MICIGFTNWASIPCLRLNDDNRRRLILHEQTWTIVHDEPGDEAGVPEETHACTVDVVMLTRTAK